MILITGGAGFIGSNLVAALSKKVGAPKITVVDRLGIDDKWKNLANHLVHQIIDPEQLDTFLLENGGSIEYIFHLLEKLVVLKPLICQYLAQVLVG